MSYILAALNKAEQDRHGGAAIEVPASASPADKKKTQWPLIISIAVAVVALCVVVYLLLRQPDHAAEAMEQSAPSMETGNNEEAGGALLQEGALAKRKTEPSLSDRQDLQQAAVQPQAAPALETSATANHPTLRALAETRSRAAPATTKMSAVGTTQEVPLPVDEQGSWQAYYGGEVVGGVQFSDEPLDDQASGMQGGEQEASLDQIEHIPALHSLSASVRAGLPRLELNVHVFAESPAKRFVYINSQRYGEGDEIEGGVTVERIISNGVILSHKGILFRLPLET